MGEFLKNNGSQERGKIDPMTCQLGLMLVEKLRYTRFISTKELEKLSTCSELGELEKYFELEKSILEIIFRDNPEKQKNSRFTKVIYKKLENSEILTLIERYISVDYVRLNAKDFDEENIIGVKLDIKKDSKGKFYISNIEIVNK